MHAEADLFYYGPTDYILHISVTRRIVLPFHFKNINSVLYFSKKNLAWLNRETLTCCRFDIHEMLMDLAHNNLGTKSGAKRYGTIGSSPFRMIPKNRTCKEAGIPDEYCICARAKHLSTNDTRVKTAAKDLVAYINSDLLGSTINRNVCSPLYLTHILGAQIVYIGTQPKGFRVTYRIMVQVMPSNAQFEGNLQVYAWNRRGKVVGDVNRINRYGNQSHCVNDNIIRLYCYCTDLLGGTKQNETQQITFN